MLKLHHSLLFVSFLVVVVSAWDVRQHLGTKTPYNAWVGSGDDVSATLKAENCELVHVNTIGRHGARYPTSSTCDDFLDLEDYLSYHSYEIQPAYAFMKGWVSPYTDKVQDLLCSSGKQELYGIGYRFARNFSSLIPASTTFNQLPVQITTVCYKCFFSLPSKKPRTGQSATSFLLGMTQNYGELTDCGIPAFSMWSESADEDVTLRFFDVCTAYQEMVFLTFHLK